MRTSAGNRLSIRALSVASVITFAALVAFLIAVISTTAIRASHARLALEENTIASDVTVGLDRTLREYDRVANLWLISEDPDAQSTRAALESDARAQLITLQNYVGEPVEGQTLASLSSNVESYFQARRIAEAAAMTLEQKLRMLRPAFERTLESSERLRATNRADRLRSERALEAALSVQTRATLVCTGLLFVGLFAIVLGAREWVQRPILELQGAIRRFANGDKMARAKGGRLVETKELAARFNELTETIAQNRRDQLAYLAAVAHDLRGPLTAAKMLAQLIERAEAARTPASFRRLDQQHDRLTRMIEDLLDAARIEAGELELRLVPFDAREPVRNIAELYAQTTATHELSVEVPNEPVVVLGDVLRFEQVLSNLLMNAIKYSPGGGRVGVTLQPRAGEAELAVSDHGIGIAAEELPRLFQPFRRLARAKDAIPGAGLGLSSVRRIVDAHHGRIAVESAQNVGTTVRVIFPLAEGARPSPPAKKPDAPRAEPR
jgi:signal transduction histidine kinase